MSVRQLRLTGAEMRALSRETSKFLKGRQVECDVDECGRAPTHAIRFMLEIAQGEDLPAVSYVCLDHAQRAALAGDIPLSEGA